MAIPAPEETLLGVTPQSSRPRRVKPVLAPIERRDPPRVKGFTEFVGTQRPTEKQVAEKPIAPPKPQDVSSWYRTTTNVSGDTYERIVEQTGSSSNETRKRARAQKADADARYQTYVGEFNKEYAPKTAEYNDSVKTYNQAIGYLDPQADRAAAQKILKRTGVKTVMS